MPNKSELRRSSRRLFYLSLALGSIHLAAFLQSAESRLDALFPKDRIIELNIEVAEDDWDTLRHQTRNVGTALGPGRQLEPPPSPYTYVEAKVRIDGVTFPAVGLRKKGFLGSQDDQRPSLKIKLNHVDKDLHIGGLTSLTFNNNKQDRSLMSQFMGYAFFNAAGSPAPRCAFAKVIVNGRNLGIYSHVESVKEPLLEREFGTSDGTLYEGTVVDFFPDWEGSFELKSGNAEEGKTYLTRLTEVLHDLNGTSLIGTDIQGKAWVPTYGKVDASWFLPEFDDASWHTFHQSVGYETDQGYQSLIGEQGDFKKAMFRKATSLYVRIPFRLDNLSALESEKIMLRIKGDDGFIAYLNGTEVARHNAPEQPDWQSAATGSTEDSVAVIWRDMDLSSRHALFNRGENVLAIHALNITPNSTDFLMMADLQTGDFNRTKKIWDMVDEEAFYTYWAVEGLLSFWDGYSGNRNNFFVYINPQTDRMHFMPWGADCLYQKYSPLGVDPRSPRSVRTVGMLAHALYQDPNVRSKYATRMKHLLEHLWIEPDLLREIDRIEQMLTPHLSAAQTKRVDFNAIRSFIRERRTDIEKEVLADQMPVWNQPPGPPWIIGAWF